MFYNAERNGFFDPDFGPVPEGSQPISDAEYLALMGAQANGQRIGPGRNGMPMAAPVAPPSIGAQQAVAHAALIDWIERFLLRFTAGTPAVEIASWPTKAIAADAHLAGKPQDIILGEALLTGENPDALAAIIQGKSRLYIAIIARMTGLRRMATKMILAATTQQEVAAALDDALATAHQLVADLGLSQES